MTYVLECCVTSLPDHTTRDAQQRMLPAPRNEVVGRRALRHGGGLWNATEQNGTPLGSRRTARWRV
jgi:hypothetical protein